MRGFSLVELSIVLVILGLLTGGILAGQSLIRASELRSVTSDMSRYQAAIHTFRDKYFSIPGDMTNAQSFWGVAHATPATCLTTVGTGTQTCNGNGDGFAEGFAGFSCGERHRFWQHLANAGLIEGAFTGVAGAGGTCHGVIGTNSPRSKISTAGFTIAAAMTPVSGSTDYFDGVYGNILFFGNASSNSAASVAAIRAEEAWNMDTKMDDGRPAYGTLQSYKTTATWGTPTCSSTAVSNTAEYVLNSSDIRCAVMFMLK